jgi:peptidoglycan/LPS O-acetylase OafA/YrhL
MAEPTPQSARNVAFDNLRVVAMLLGLVSHGVLPHKATGLGQYPMRDCETSVLADVAYYATHNYRMQLFFLVAGFAACALASRRGVGALVRNRILRIVVPLVVSIVTVAPLMHALFAVHQVEQAAERFHSDWGWFSGPEVQLADGTTQELSVLAALDPVPWMGPNYHLWFLYYLALCCVPFIAWLAFAPRPMDGPLVRAADAAFRYLLGRWWTPALFAALGAPLIWLRPDWWIDTPQWWRPSATIYLYYLGFFVFGALLYRHRDRLAVYGRHWAALLLIANVVVMPVMLKLTISGNYIEDEAGANPPAWLVGWKAASVFVTGLYTWMMMEGLIGLFERHFTGSPRWWKYLADSAYWCYLAGFPVQVAFQVWLADTPMTVPGKFLFVNALTFAVLLVSYELCVRHTWIGLMLNGKRPERKAAAPEPVVIAARVRVDAAHPEPTGPRWQPQEQGQQPDRIEAGAETRN